MSLPARKAALERPSAPPPSPRRVLADFGGVYLASAIVAFVFAATGPVAIILAVGARGGIGADELASWMFGAFFVNGLLSIAFCWIYRQPLVCLWTIPGAVLVGPALGHMGFAEAVGAFVVTGILTFVLGLSGWVRRAMDAVPMPIVMSMVAGVFLRFGLDLVFAVRDDFWIAAPMVAAFVAASVSARVARWLPPLVAALLVGVVIAIALDRFVLAGGPITALALPILHTPVFSWAAMLELVVPLAVTVLVVHNGQGVAVLRAAGHEPPVDAITMACGLTTVVTGLFGAVPTCLTGPTNAILAAAGERHRQYTAGICVGLLATLFGLLSPLFTQVLVSAPRAFIATIAGLAMLRVIQSAFTVAFRDRFALGALVTFLVTVADVPIANVGAPFWGLVFGFTVSALLERADFAAAKP